MSKQGSIGMSKLLANASKLEKEIKETDNVAETISPEIEKNTETEATKAEEVKDKGNVLSEKIENPSQEVSKEKEEKSSKKEEYNSLFQDKKIKDTEMIRISSEAHAKLKKLATVTGVSMHVLATNILNVTFEKYNKEIQTAIKKYMSL